MRNASAGPSRLGYSSDPRPALVSQAERSASKAHCRAESPVPRAFGWYPGFHRRLSQRTGESHARAIKFGGPKKRGGIARCSHPAAAPNARTELRRIARGKKAPSRRPKIGGGRGKKSGAAHGVNLPGVDAQVHYLIREHRWRRPDGTTLLRNGARNDSGKRAPVTRCAGRSLVGRNGQLDGLYQTKRRRLTPALKEGAGHLDQLALRKRLWSQRLECRRWPRRAAWQQRTGVESGQSWDDSELSKRRRRRASSVPGVKRGRWVAALVVRMGVVVVNEEEWLASRRWKDVLGWHGVVLRAEGDSTPGIGRSHVRSTVGIPRVKVVAARGRQVYSTRAKRSVSKVGSWGLSLEGGDGTAQAVLWDLREGGVRQEKRRESAVNNLRSGRSLKSFGPTATVPSLSLR
ncbi:hypothetical protein BJ912DRAFT_1067399 [Pholiota molesta]|nr:hypothetical protein BJ912DRAFT_1067399 [Pholiota molesta]